jgi:uncharacterized protein (TIRG00374 family)
MGKKRTLLYLVIGAILATLVYLQFRTWRNFDWATFWSQTGDVRQHWGNILAAIVLIYVAYIMRAIRWMIFLRPVKKTTVASLTTPTVVGFTGLALLGRAGELIRPYLIARKEQLPFSSQLAVLVVERIFDVGGFTTLLVYAIFLTSGPKALGHYESFREAGFVLILLVTGLSALCGLISWKGDLLAGFMEERFSHLAAGLGRRIALRIREFRRGLNTIHGLGEFLQLAAVSIGMWYIIALAYYEVIHSYGVPALALPLSQIFLLILSSMVGSIIQLPGVGGGSQLATIAMLEHIFKVPHELAASCGILLWLVTFFAVVPLGLALAHRERLSLRKISEAAEHEEEVTTSTP